MSLPEHLGGHYGRVNKDFLTLCYLVTRYGLRSMLDVGCGPGGMLDEAQVIGLLAAGVDGDPSVAEADRRITCHDYTRGPLYWAPVDLVWSTEFVEHVEPEYIGNFLATFAAGRVLFLTAAPPGFPGHHHVNCQADCYWIELLRRHGWAQDLEATAWARAHGQHEYTRATGMVFTRAQP
jgi:SAM-dependent methyltransferase